MFIQNGELWDVCTSWSTEKFIHTTKQVIEDVYISVASTVSGFSNAERSGLIHLSLRSEEAPIIRSELVK